MFLTRRCAPPRRAQAATLFFSSFFFFLFSITRRLTRKLPLARANHYVAADAHATLYSLTKPRMILVGLRRRLSS